MRSNLNRAVIKEELVAITGDYRRAIILNYFIEQHLDEWFFKNIKKLSEDTLLKMTEPTITKIINDLVEMDFLLKRRNPQRLFNNAYQFKVNIEKITENLDSKFPVIPER